MRVLELIFGREGVEHPPSQIGLRRYVNWSAVYTESTHLPSTFALNVIMPILDITDSFVMKKEMTMEL